MTRSLYCSLFLLLAGTAAHAQFRAIRETNFKKVYVDSTLWVNYLQSAGSHYAMVVYDSIDKQFKSVPPSAGGGGTGTNQPITWTGTGDVSGTATGTTSLTPSLSLSSIITAGTIGGSTQIPIITYDAKGRIISTSSTGISGANGGTVTSVGLSSSDITVGGSASPITGSGAWTLTLPNINANTGTFNNLTVNAKGQVTAASNTSYLTSFTETDPVYTSLGVSLAGTQTLTGVKTFPAATVSNPSFVIPSGSAYTGTTTGATWVNNNHIYTYLNGGVQQLDNQVTSANAILNQTTLQSSANFNIDGIGKVGSLTFNTTPASGTITDSLLTINIATGAVRKIANTVKLPITLTDAATVSWNYALGYNASVTLGGNRTLAVSNTGAGDYGTVKVIQDATGNRTLTLPANSKVNGYWGSGTSIVLSTTANAIDLLSFYYDGTNYYWTLGRNYQ